MASVARTSGSAASLLLPGVLLCGLLAVLGVQTGLIRVPSDGPRIETPAIVTVAPRLFSYRDGGDFLRDGFPADGPLIAVTAPPPLEIMKYQVSATDYARCVAADRCEAAEPRRRALGDVPVTGVSFDDANDYARWLSEVTGQTWRLPTVEEWAFAAGSRAVDHALNVETDPQNPADRWLAFYEKEAALGDAAVALVQPLGSFGLNEHGVADLAGSVWEWTATCAGRKTLGPGGEVLSRIESCGVRYLEGRHRTPMSAFVRDARGGGCSVGAPPDHLGFRLVRERPWYAPVAELLNRLVGRTA